MSGLVDQSADARSKTIDQNFRCRAWVNFSGDSSTVRASGNVSSVTFHSAGQYTMNFTQAMPDNDYCAVLTHENIAYGGTSWIFGASDVTPSSVKMGVYDNSSSMAYQDTAVGCIAIFR